MPRLHFRQGRTPGTHCIGGILGPRTDLDDLKRIILSPPDSNADASTVQSLASCYIDCAIQSPYIACSINQKDAENGRPWNILKQCVTSKQAWLTIPVSLNMWYRYSNLPGYHAPHLGKFLYRYHAPHFHHSHWKLLSVGAVLLNQLRIILYIR